MPYFSIVMPTRNRGNLLRNSLQSALEQKFDDFEIIVSDNFSSDCTADVAEEFGSNKVKYVRTPQMYAMPDSWEFALSHARGEYVTILSDDDALSPTVLSRAAAYAEESKEKLVSWTRMVYIYNDWYVEEKRNTLLLEPLTQTTQTRSSSEFLSKWFNDNIYYGNAPMLFNAVCHRSVIEKVKSIKGSFFISPAPDVGASIAMLSVLKSYLHVDDAMSLAGSGLQSIGANVVYNRGTALQTYASEFGGKEFARGPFHSVTLTTSVAETLLAAKEQLPEYLSAYPFNWSSYFVNCYKDLSRYAESGADVSDEMALLDSLVQEQPADVQAAYENAKLRSGEIGSYVKMKTSLKIAVKRALGMPTEKLSISGADEGFSNILECARKLDGIVASRFGKKTASAVH